MTSLLTGAADAHRFLSSSDESPVMDEIGTAVLLDLPNFSVPARAANRNAHWAPVSLE
jgi:hypothetical protein